MASNDLGKDLLLIHARMFKHHAVLDGEAKYFIKEFESRRNNRELKRLDEVVSSSNSIDHNLSECVSGDLHSQRLQSLQENVSMVIKTADGIINKEKNDDAVRNVNKAKRDAEWEKFVKEMEIAKQDVERRHRQRVNELKSKKQHQPSPGSTP